MEAPLFPPCEEAYTVANLKEDSFCGTWMPSDDWIAAICLSKSSRIIPACRSPPRTLSRQVWRRASSASSLAFEDGVLWGVELLLLADIVSLLLNLAWGERSRSASSSRMGIRAISSAYFSCCSLVKWRTVQLSRNRAIILVTSHSSDGGYALAGRRSGNLRKFPSATIRSST